MRARTILLWAWLLLLSALFIWSLVAFALAFHAAAPVWAPVALNLFAAVLAWRLVEHVRRKL
jgi:hypothetical protein